MTAEEYLKTKGWAQDNPIIGGALWSAMVEMLEEYHQAKLKSLLNLDTKPITLLLGVVEIESLIDVYKKDLKEVEKDLKASQKDLQNDPESTIFFMAVANNLDRFELFSVFIKQLEQIKKKLKDSVIEDMKKSFKDDTQ